MLAASLLVAALLAQTSPRVTVERAAVLIQEAPCVDEPALTCDSAQMLGPSEVLTRPAWVALATEHERLQRENAGLHARVASLEGALASPVLWLGLGIVLGVGAALAAPHVLR